MPEGTNSSGSYRQVVGAEGKDVCESKAEGGYVGNVQKASPDLLCTPSPMCFLCSINSADDEHPCAHLPTQNLVCTYF